MTKPNFLSPQQRRLRNREEMIATIVQAARDIMREEGVAALNLNEIARRLGMKPPSLYEYFPNKMALYDHLFLLGTRLFLEKVAEVQVFGIRKSADTRKALRFFAERRIKTHFVDLMERPASRGELTRFVARFGVDALVDRSSTRFRELGLVHARLNNEQWLARLVDDPLLLRMPLVRNGQRLTLGADENAWREWTGR